MKTRRDADRRSLLDPSHGKPVRILLADDHPVVRHAIAAMLANIAGWEVCGVADDGREAIERAGELQADVVVLDLHMPGLSGVDTIREIRRRVRAAEVVVFSGAAADDVVAEVFEAGAKSFVSKNASGEVLVEAIRAAAEHRQYITPQVSDILVARALEEATQPSAGGTKITAREREIIRHVAQGASNKDIGAALGISSRTAETHRATIMRKLGASSVADIVRYAIRHSIVDA